MGRPLTALGVPPFAGVALNRFAPKLNAPPGAPPPLLPAVAGVDALPVPELPLPEPNANGAALGAPPKANGGGAVVDATGSGMPNGLTGLVGTGILLAMLPNAEVGLAAAVELEPKANGEEEEFAGC